MNTQIEKTEMNTNTTGNNLSMTVDRYGVVKCDQTGEVLGFHPEVNGLVDELDSVAVKWGFKNWFHFRSEQKRFGIVGHFKNTKI